MEGDNQVASSSEVEIGSRPPVPDRLKSLVASLVSHISNLPPATVEDRRELQELSDTISRVVEAEEVDDTAKQLEQASSRVCTGADAAAQKLLEKREAELRGIMEALGTSLRELGTSNQRSGGQLNACIDELEEALGSESPDLAADRLRGVAAEIKKATSKVREDLETTSTEVGSVNARLEQMERELEAARDEALRDPLTKLANRRCLSDKLGGLGEASGSDGMWSLIMLDIDHFKQVNDTHGHMIGDAVLVKVARILRGTVPDQHLVARYGGEEFAVLLADLDLEKACNLAEQLRSQVASARWQYGEGPDAKTIAPKVSLGVAQRTGAEAPEGLVNRADSALYRAKETGRNKVCRAE